MILTILIFLLILSILVTIHEAGHFFVAKWSGMKVEEFGFGLPPRAWGKKIGETIYSINWLPFGGFVKVFGEDEAGAGKVQLSSAQATPEVSETDKNRAFYAKPLKNRIAVVVAGVIMNLLLAIAIYYVVLATHGFTTEVALLTDHKFVGVEQQNKFSLIVSTTADNSPAKTAGIMPQDRIVAADGNAITNVDGFRTYIESKKGTEVQLKVVNPAGEERTVMVTPRVDVPAGQGPTGITFDGYIETASLKYATPMAKVFSGVLQTYNVGVYSFEVMGQLLGNAVKERNITQVSEGVAGPIGIGRIVGELIGIGGGKAFYALLEFMALLSLNLAVVNILPFPALDGGRLLFLVIEGITRRRVNPKVEQFVNTAGMAILLMLIAVITLNDLRKLFM